MEELIDSRLIERFWDKADITNKESCWDWNNHILPSGYGQFRVGNKKYRAHRVSWNILNGPIPKGMMILHNCDNKRCVNPYHLKLGTHCDNMVDVVDRKLGGAGNGSIRFYKGEIQLIRKLRVYVSCFRYNKYKFSATYVSKMFKCSPQTILNIWKSLEYKCREGYYV